MGISISVNNVHTIKPLDTSFIKEIISNYSYIFTAEDHNIIGGLGSAIADVMSEIGTSSKLTKIGIPDVFGQKVEHKLNFTKNMALDACGIANTIKAYKNN